MSIVGNQREYIEWLVSECTMSDTPIGEILEAEAQYFYRQADSLQV